MHKPQMLFNSPLNESLIIFSGNCIFALFRIQPLWDHMKMKNNIKKFREFNNLTQEFVAEQLGISQSNYSRLENGHIRLDVGRALLLADLFRVELAMLFHCSTHIQGFCSNLSQCYPHLGDKHSELVQTISLKRQQ